MFKLICSLLLIGQTQASNFPRVDAALKTYDDKVATMNGEFAKFPADPHDKEWVKQKLNHMVEVDQYMRKYSDTPHAQSFSTAEKAEFTRQFMPRWTALDKANTQELKELLKIYEWFTISAFGKKADNQAWLLVQHADLDYAFQKQVLTILEKLYASHETDPTNYAYLWDRVAVSQQNPDKNKQQRYGTQGRCVGPGQWQPDPVEDPANLDKRRASVGLPPEAEYIKRFKDICH